MYSTQETVLDSGSWDRLLDECLSRIRTWNLALLTDERLDPGERLGYILARKALLAGLQSVYDNARREMPSKLRQEVEQYQE